MGGHTDRQTDRHAKGLGVNLIESIFVSKGREIKNYVVFLV